MRPDFFSGFSKLTRSWRGTRAGTPTCELAASAGSFPTEEESRNKIAYLSAMRIFRDLSKEEMNLIVSSTVMTTAVRGQLIYVPGETGEAIFLLKKGSVHIYRLSLEGRKLIIQTVGPMTFFGEMAIVGQSMQNHFAEAAEDCLVCCMGKADVERLILSKPQVAIRMMDEIGQRLHDSQERLSDSVFKGTPARIASLLLHLSSQGKQPIAGLSHQDLADTIGVYRETVTKTLGQFRDEGLIEIGRKTISLLNSQKLSEIAQEEVLRKQ
ncbi:MAG: Crp/Fnr family transcriptional regulator [Acidobacteria bacterium]|nr:Crp/Fnr family transcriptional regulator [Acidobacteriota bacterium]